jgi:hypothetical protein
MLTINYGGEKMKKIIAFFKKLFGIKSVMTDKLSEHTHEHSHHEHAHSHEHVAEVKLEEEVSLIDEIKPEVKPEENKAE